MDDTYLVEIRPARTRWQIKETTRAIVQKAGAERYRERHPHVTLYGPFTLEDPDKEKLLLDTIGKIGGTYGTIPFTVGGWEQRNGAHGGVVAFSVRPSPDLARLTEAIARALSSFTITLNAWDLQPDEKWFHVTIANLLPPGKSEEIVSLLAVPGTVAPVPAAAVPGVRGVCSRLFALARKMRFLHRSHSILLRPLLLDDAGLRITVMHNDEILGEFDLLRKCWLSQEEIHDPRSWQQSLRLYRKSAGFELSAPVVHGQDEIFLIADLHLGHENIIRYCSRPFVPADVEEMDRVLIANWNYCVAKKTGFFPWRPAVRQERTARTRSTGCFLTGISRSLPGTMIRRSPQPLFPRQILPLTGSGSCLSTTRPMHRKISTAGSSTATTTTTTFARSRSSIFPENGST